MLVKYGNNNNSTEGAICRLFHLVESSNFQCKLWEALRPYNKQEMLRLDSRVDILLSGRGPFTLISDTTSEMEE